MANLSQFDSYAGYKANLASQSSPEEIVFIREYYKMLSAYYQQNGLYTFLAEELKETIGTDENLKGIKNPCFRLVEFYVSKLSAGQIDKVFDIEAENETVKPALKKIWKWSNLASKKQLWARNFSKYGDLFIKVEASKDADENVKSVFLKVLNPENVGDFELDERGFLTKIRVDIPIIVEGENFTYCEIWDKEEGTVSFWNSHDSGLNAPQQELPNPDSTENIVDVVGDDFIPIVYQPFRDDGSGRCSSSFGPVIEKIDELNRKATRLSEISFRYNKPLWASTTTGTDANGRPLPKPDFDDSLEADGTFKVADDELIVLPGMSDIKSLVPNVRYEAFLEIVRDDVAEIVKDLPELSYYELKTSDLSGVAIRFLLDDLVSRVIEARGNFESGIIRANEMALSIGKNLSLLPELQGDFVEGSFNHSFKERPVLPLDLSEVVTNIKTLTDAGATVYSASIASGLSEIEARSLSQVDDFGALGEPEERVENDQS